jgi:hypothetical protein
VPTEVSKRNKAKGIPENNVIKGIDGGRQETFEHWREKGRLPPVQTLINV